MLDLKLMNTYLLAKWWIRFFDNIVQGKWKDIILSEYGSRTSPTVCSSFWRGILKDHKIVGLRLNKKIGNIAFWFDKWCFAYPLQCQCPNMFLLCKTDSFLLLQFFQYHIYIWILEGSLLVST